MIDTFSPHEIPVKGTHDAKFNQGDPTHSTQIGEATNPHHRNPPLNVSDRIKIEEFGKQEIFARMTHGQNERLDFDPHIAHSLNTRSTPRFRVAGMTTQFPIQSFV